MGVIEACASFVKEPQPTTGVNSRLGRAGRTSRNLLKLTLELLSSPYTNNLTPLADCLLLPRLFQACLTSGVCQRPNRDFLPLILAGATAWAEDRKRMMT